MRLHKSRVWSVSTRSGRVLTLPNERPPRQAAAKRRKPGSPTGAPWAGRGTSAVNWPGAANPPCREPWRASRTVSRDPKLEPEIRDHGTIEGGRAVGGQAVRGDRPDH